MKLLTTDILIVGGGLTGWMAAHTLYQKRECRVLMLSDGQGASPWVHGFNTPLHPEDSADVFYQDDRTSGYRQNDPALARMLCGGAKEVFDEILSLGAVFNRDKDGGYQLLRPLGSSRPRVASIGNETGPAVMKLLREKVTAHPGFSHADSAVALRLYTEGGRVKGALCWNVKQKEFFLVSCGTVLLACGGFGNIFPFTTNLPDGSGDGAAMAYEAGAQLVDMEFIQYEPSAAVYPPQVRGRGMITTLFYEGAVLKNALGERFMLRYGEQAERVNKDILARCIAKEILEGRAAEHGGVWFDATNVPADRLENDYPLYVQRYRKVGIELKDTPVELAPAPHTTLGGVVIDTACRTRVQGLLAAGEVTGGLHGANRLGGNGGLETLVFGRAAGNTLGACELPAGADTVSLTAWAEALLAGGAAKADVQPGELRAAMQSSLARAAAVVRTGAVLDEETKRVRQVLEQLRGIKYTAPSQRFEKLRLENDTLTALLLLMSARERTETVGCHVREDYPDREKTRYRVLAEKSPAGIRISREDWTKQSEEA